MDKNTTKSESERENGLGPNDYYQAILVQNACNLCGVVQSFAEILPRIKTDSTAARNEHPICRLFAEQIISLAGGMSSEAESYHHALQTCRIEAAKDPEIARSLRAMGEIA